MTKVLEEHAAMPEESNTSEMEWNKKERRVRRLEDLTIPIRDGDGSNVTPEMYYRMERRVEGLEKRVSGSEIAMQALSQSQQESSSNRDGWFNAIGENIKFMRAATTFVIRLFCVTVFVHVIEFAFIAYIVSKLR